MTPTLRLVSPSVLHTFHGLHGRARRSADRLRGCARLTVGPVWWLSEREAFQPHCASRERGTALPGIKLVLSKRAFDGPQRRRGTAGGTPYTRHVPHRPKSTPMIVSYPLLRSRRQTVSRWCRRIFQVAF